jgi:hypothetical protein
MRSASQRNILAIINNVTIHKIMKRPSQNHSKPLNVTFGVALAQIIDVVSQGLID